MNIGTDAEFAVKMGGVFVPAGKLPIKGRKGEPEKLAFGGVEIDCCAVEITPPPSITEDGFVLNITQLLNEVKDKYGHMAELHTVSSLEFDKELLDSTRWANEMGCDPDFNAWTGEKNPRPETSMLRTFGGHVHLQDGTIETIRACDLTLGMWSVLADEDTRRRQLYGKAGAFRYKTYGKRAKGVEYRVLSNFWYKDEVHMRTCFRLANEARRIATNIDEAVTVAGGPYHIQDVINHSLKDEASRILRQLEVSYAAR